MPRKRYEEEIEEILEKMDVSDARPANDPVSTASDEEPKDGRLISWEEVPESRPQRRRTQRRKSSGGSSIVLTPTRLIVAAVIVVVFVLATNIWPLIAVALLLFGAAYYLNKRRGGPGLVSGRRQQKYWRDSPIDFDGDDSDADDGPGNDNQWRGG